MSAERDSLIASLPMPPWVTNHGQTYEEFGGQIRCLRHYTRLDRGTACPACVREAREHERATRDD